MPRLSDEDRAARRAAYLAKAAILMARGELTMRRLAREVGMSVGSTYEYFISRSAIVSELLDLYAMQHSGRGLALIELNLALFEQGNERVLHAVVQIMTGKDTDDSEGLKSDDISRAEEDSLPGLLLVLSSGGRPSRI